MCCKILPTNFDAKYAYFRQNGPLIKLIFKWFTGIIGIIRYFNSTMRRKYLLYSYNRLQLLRLGIRMPDFNWSNIWLESKYWGEERVDSVRINHQEFDFLWTQHAYNGFSSAKEVKLSLVLNLVGSGKPFCTSVVKLSNKKNF